MSYKYRFYLSIVLWITLFSYTAFTYRGSKLGKILTKQFIEFTKKVKGE